MSVATPLFTAGDLLRLPRGECRYELVKGELVTMLPAGHAHGRVAGRFTTRLGPFVEQHLLGEIYAAETGFLLRSQPDTVRAPDVAFVRAERVAAAAKSTGAYFPGPPDLAVEVVSPSDTYTHVEDKVADWLACGTRVVVVLDPQRQAAAIHRAAGNVVLLCGADRLTLDELFPGWSITLADLFR